MIESDFEKFGVIMFRLAEEFNAKVSTDALKTKFENLKDYEIEKVAGACSWIIQNREVTYPPMPRIKEIIDAIKKIYEKELPGRDVAEAQADLVLRTLREIGGYRGPDFKDPITKNLMSCRWPWSEFASTLMNEDIKFWRIRFVDAYISYQNIKEFNDFEQIGFRNGENTGTGIIIVDDPTKKDEDFNRIDLKIVK